MSYLRDSVVMLALALLVLAVVISDRLSCTPDMPRPPAPSRIDVILHEPPVSPQRQVLSDVSSACARACRETQPCDLWAESETDEPPQRPWQELRLQGSADP